MIQKIKLCTIFIQIHSIRVGDTLNGLFEPGFEQAKRIPYQGLPIGTRPVGGLASEDHGQLTNVIDGVRRVPLDLGSEAAKAISE